MGAGMLLNAKFAAIHLHRRGAGGLATYAVDTAMSYVAMTCSNLC